MKKFPAILATSISACLLTAATSPAVATTKAPEAISVSATPAPAVKVDPRNAQWENAVNSYFAENPDDYVGINRVSLAAGGSELKWTFPDAGLSDVSSEAAAAALARARAATPEPKAGTGTDVPQARIASVPVDAFNVGGTSSWIQSTDQFVFVGTWNFRDNYVGSGGPHDVSSLSFQNSCWEDGGTHWTIYDYSGKNNTSTGYLAWGAINKTSIVQMRDQTSGFVLSNDHGTHVQYAKKGGDKQCNVVPVGQFNFQHSQGGGSVESVNAGWGFFSVTFSGNSAYQLTKSTATFHG